MSLFRTPNVLFALTLATAWLVIPLAGTAGRPMDGPLVNFVVAGVATAAVLAADIDVETAEVWTFSGVAFLVGVVVHLLGDTGANSGEAGPLVVLGVWVVSVAVAGVVAFRD